MLPSGPRLSKLVFMMRETKIKSTAMDVELGADERDALHAGEVRERLGHSTPAVLLDAHRHERRGRQTHPVRVHRRGEAGDDAVPLETLEAGVGVGPRDVHLFRQGANGEPAVQAEGADDLAVGMATQIRFPALQERNIPILEGRLANVSADSFEDERSGARFFRIEVEVPREQLAVISEFRARGGLKPGLPAEVLIPLRKRSALSYLTEPLTQTLWRAGREH